MDGWGGELLAEDHLPEAIAVLRLNAENNPKSSRAEDSLGEAYAKAGKKEAAIDSYRRALAIDPEDGQAKERVKALEASGPVAK